MTGQNQPPSVFIIAGEPSGDLLGASVIRALRHKRPDLTFQGIGGDALQAQGLSSLFPMDDITAIGFLAVLGKLPLLLRRIHEAAEAVIAARPTVLVLVDSPDFTMRVAKKVRRAAPEIPIIKLVCPTVWAWRPGRAKAMQPYINEVLALFPFEPEMMQRLGGPPCHYIGHPMIERMEELSPSSMEESRRMRSPPVVLALPGSRSGEITRLAPVFGEALGRLASQYGPLDIRVPTIERKAGMMREAVRQWPVPATVLDQHDERMQAFREARVAVAASGTVTLELAMAGIPMLAAYKVSTLEQKIMEQLVITRFASLPNIILGRAVVPELLQGAANATALAEGLGTLLQEDHPSRREQVEAFRELRQIMGVGALKPAESAAERICTYF